jgi:hypothetical protein
MKQNIIIISLSQFRITNPETKKIENEGCTVRYIMAEDLSHYEDKARGVKGYAPAKATIPYDDFDKFQTVPALYEATIDAKVDSAGKVSLKPTEFKFLSALSLNKSNGFGKMSAREAQ